MRLIPALFVLLSLSAQASGRKAPAHQPSPSPTLTASPLPQPSASPRPSPSPVASGWKFTPVVGTAKEIQRVKDSGAAIELVKASQCFADYFTKRSLIQTNGMTNAGVIEFIRRSSVSVPITYYYANNGTVGYTYPNDPVVYVNRKFHDAYGVCAEGSGNGHEALHKLGFEHDYNRTARRPYSVPYSWNAMFDYCCPKVLGHE